MEACENGDATHAPERKPARAYAPHALALTASTTAVGAMWSMLLA
ncbi:hypothetical protein PHYC_02183 [Phycisphaerales bacterium]|nr:hypothetical protein PHYC_02183 [Phycisphaerales bacterium]